MKLSPTHRETLTRGLTHAIEQGHKIRQHIDKLKPNEADLLQSLEIDEYLNEVKIKAIKEAIKDNEIDY